MLGLAPLQLLLGRWDRRLGGDDDGLDGRLRLGYGRVLQLSAGNSHLVAEECRSAGQDGIPVRVMPRLEGPIVVRPYPCSASVPNNNSNRVAMSSK